MESRKRPTLRDVAERAGVSTAVVSYVLNNGPRQTSAATRARVQQAIADLEYHPNNVARGLRARQTRVIGFVANDFHPLESFGSHYLSSILSAVVETLKADQHFLLMYPLEVGADAPELDGFLNSGQLDGIILRMVQDPPATDALVERIARSGLPCVCIERPAAARFGLPAVTFDDEGGAEAATRLLLDRGRRRIAHLMGDPRYATARARRAGYASALAAAGIAVDPRLTPVANWGMTEAATATRELLALDAPPDAIFAASDDMALGAREALRAANRLDAIPVIGFDGAPLGQEMIPPLLSVRIPLAEIGRAAARLVLHPEPGGEPALIRLPTSLLVPGE